MAMKTNAKITCYIIYEAAGVNGNCVNEILGNSSNFNHLHRRAAYSAIELISSELHSNSQHNQGTGTVNYNH